MDALAGEGTLEQARSACGTAFALMQVETAHILRPNEKDTVMRHSYGVQNYVCPREDRDVMLFSAWLLACALLLEENDQSLSQRQAQQGRVEYAI